MSCEPISLVNLMSFQGCLRMFMYLVYMHFIINNSITYLCVVFFWTFICHSFVSESVYNMEHWNEVSSSAVNLLSFPCLLWQSNAHASCYHCRWHHLLRCRKVHVLDIQVNVVWILCRVLQRTKAKLCKLRGEGHFLTKEAVKTNIK